MQKRLINSPPNISPSSSRYRSVWLSTTLDIKCNVFAPYFSCIRRWKFDTTKKKQTNQQNGKQTYTAGAASAFEPDFVFPLENVTVAQGRDGLYSNKSNKLFTCVGSRIPTLHLMFVSCENRIVLKSSMASTLRLKPVGWKNKRANIFEWKRVQHLCGVKNANNSKFAANARQRGNTHNGCVCVRDCVRVTSKCIRHKQKRQNILDLSYPF